MAALFASRWLRAALLVWAGVFFCLVVPLHHRGLIALPGAETAPSETQAPYCPLCTVWNADDGPARPPADAPVGCALCHLKSNLELPVAWCPPPDLVAELDFLLPPGTAQRVLRFAAASKLRVRGPPPAANA